MRVCLIRCSLSAHSSCFVPLHCNHTITLKEVPKHFPCNTVAQKALVALLQATILPISSVLYAVKVPRVSAAPMLSVREYHSTTRTGRCMPEGSPLPFIPSEDSNVTVNSLMPFTRPVPGSDLTPTELEFSSSLEGNRMLGSSTESLGPAFPRVSRVPETYVRTGSALSPVHDH